VNARLRILIYSHGFAPAIGGVETFTMQLARGLAALTKGHERPEITLATQTPANGFTDASLPFRVVRRPSLSQLFRLLRESDVVHLAGPSLLPLLLARLVRKRIVVEHHGFQTVCPNGQMMHRPTELPCPGHFAAGRHLECWRCNAPDGWVQSLKMWLLTFPRQRLCRSANANITPTAWLSTILQLPRQTTIHHAVTPPASFARPAASGKMTFAFVGRLVSTKGVGVLLDAAALLSREGRQFQLLIIGDGPERVRLEAKSRELQLESVVNFTGALKDKALDDALAGVAAIVLPSLGGEVFGLAAAENMARGRAMVVSGLGSLSEVVGDAGLKSNVGDAPDLARQLECLMDHPQQLQELASKASSRAASLFQPKRMIDQHLRIYREVG
jgi:glycogen(starch) synthase